MVGFPFAMSASRLLLAAGLLAWCALASAQAGTFVRIAQERRASTSASLQLLDQETGKASSTADQRESFIKRRNFGTAELDVGVSIRLADLLSGDGRSFQRSTPGAEEIRFEGLADVNVAGYAPYPLLGTGSGQAGTSFSYTFELQQTVVINLQMNSVVGRYGDEDYRFRLWDTLSEQDIWTAVIVDDDVTGPTRSFSRLIKLAPGTYNVTASVTAASFLYDTTQWAGRTDANFEITAFDR
jgi:hypothetical protein